jgi:hypothetical protein
MTTESQWQARPALRVSRARTACMRGSRRGCSGLRAEAARSAESAGYLVAASYCSATLAGMRPRSLTGMPWAFAHARMSPLRSSADEIRPVRRH